MSEIEQLLSKPKADVEAIVVQFGLLSADEASSKSSLELVSLLSGVPVDQLSPAESAPKKTTKKTAKKKADKTSETTESTEDSKKETTKKTTAKKATVKKETSKKTKTTKSSSKTKAAEETKVAEEIKEVPVEDTSAEAPVEEKPAAKKRGRKKKEEVSVSETVITTEVVTAPEEVVSETTEVSASIEVPTEEPVKKKGRKKKTSSKSEKEVEAPSETPADESVENKDEATSKEESKEEKKSSDGSKKTRGKKRRISFGPEQEIKQVELTPEEEKASEEATSEETPAQPVQPEIQYIDVEGVLSIGSGDNKNDYCGFVHRNNYLPGEEDAYVPGQMIRRLGLRKGDYIKGLAVPPRGKEKYSPLRRVLSVNGIEIPDDSDFSEIKKRPKFESLTAIYPDERLTLETGSGDLSCRIIDLFSPIGKGQRGMIVSPPKAGKTILLKKVANAITANNPNCKVIVLLIDERPEEVTDMQRSINGEVVYSTFDKRPENHVRVTELVLERAMRLVELGEDVVILLDSMTRLARAYNLTINPTGRTLSGGLDPGSLYGPKRFFGAARNIEFGGSLTIIATALIETGSRMDEVIFEEFKGTGNMEVVLDRKLADRRIYPAIAVDKSGTRREDLLLSEEELESVWLTRKAIADVDTLAATEAVINYMKRTTGNASFVLSAKKSFAVDS